MDLFSTEKRQAVYDYLETDKGRKSIEVFTRGLMSHLKRALRNDEKDVGFILEAIDKVVLTVKFSKQFDYAVVEKQTCAILLEYIREIINLKVLKVALYVFQGDNDLSINVQKALFFTLTGHAYTIATANAYFGFLDQTIMMEMRL